MMKRASGSLSLQRPVEPAQTLPQLTLATGPQDGRKLPRPLPENLRRLASRDGQVAPKASRDRDLLRIVNLGHHRLAKVANRLGLRKLSYPALQLGLIQQRHRLGQPIPDTTVESKRLAKQGPR